MHGWEIYLEDNQYEHPEEINDQAEAKRKYYRLNHSATQFEQLQQDHSGKENNLDQCHGTKDKVHVFCHLMV